MLALDATNKTIRIELGGAITTNELDYAASWADITSTSFTPGTSEAPSNGVFAVTLVAAPAASTQRRVQSISIFNKDTAAATVKVEITVAGSPYVIFGCVLQTKEMLTYEDGEGWQVTSASGKLKSKA